MTSLASSEACSIRAKEFLEASQSLLAIEGAGREWAAVALFYSAYHCARSAMLDDPIFQNASALSKVNPRLQMADREATHHQGRKGSDRHGPGVSQIVPLLYPVISADYRALFQASLDVRYGARLVAPLDDLAERCKRINDRFDDGALVAVAR